MIRDNKCNNSHISHRLLLCNTIHKAGLFAALRVEQELKREPNFARIAGVMMRY